MATAKTSFSTPNNRSVWNTNNTGDSDSDFNSQSVTPTDSVFEFNESELYPSDEPPSPDFTKTLTKPVKTKSKPIDIPDWSKILKDQYIGNRWGGTRDDREYEDGDDWAPPHEIIARRVARDRTRVVSFSMHEGIGRTLKGRDLIMVRNAVFAKFGFAD